jgi:hypothetical protein
VRPSGAILPSDLAPWSHTPYPRGVPVKHVYCQIMDKTTNVYGMCLTKIHTKWITPASSTRHTKINSSPEPRARQPGTHHTTADDISPKQ